MGTHCNTHQLCCSLTGATTQTRSSPSGILLLAEHLANLICNLPVLEKGKLYVDEGVECRDSKWDTIAHGGGGDPWKLDTEWPLGLSCAAYGPLNEL